MKLHLRLPWSRDEEQEQHDEEMPPTEADLAKEAAEAQLVSVHALWPEVLRLHFDLEAERTKNHFSERWERELRANARRS